MEMTTLHLARLNVTIGTSRGWAYCVTPSGARVWLTVRQLAALMREARFIEAADRRETD